MDAVAELRTAIALPSGSLARSGGSDWGGIERELGTALPSDYKRLVSEFPDGSYQGLVRLALPVGDRYPDHFRNRLGDMRRWREQDPRRFPFPVHPEPGGLLPCGRTRRQDLIFWRTDSPDPDDWPIVVADREFVTWSPFTGGLAAFLLAVVRREFDTTPLGVSLPPLPPHLEQVGSTAADPIPRASQSRADFWLRKARRASRPVSEVDALTRQFRAPSATSQVDWTALECRLGSALPNDYKTVIQTHGPGSIADLTIAHTDPDVDGSLLHLVAEKARLATRHPNRDGMVPPVHPDRGGMLAWGTFDDGWFACWAPVGSDPDHWGTVLVEPELVGYDFYPELSFSGFLSRYATDDSFRAFLGRTTTQPRPAEFRSMS